MKNDSKRWLSSREACRIIGVRPKTLREWDKAGKIRTKRTPGKHRRYDVSSVLGVSEADIGGHRKNFIYARVSSQKQKNDLERQIQSLSSEFPGYEVISDVGSGLNWNRRGLKRLLRLCILGEVSTVVVAHRDRLSRLAFDLIEYIVEETGAKLVVRNQDESVSPSEELGEDLLSIVHDFSSRAYGRRSYKRKRTATKEKEESKGKSSKRSVSSSSSSSETSM